METNQRPLTSTLFILFSNFRTSMICTLNGSPFRFDSRSCSSVGSFLLIWRTTFFTALHANKTGCSIAFREASRILNGSPSSILIMQALKKWWITVISRNRIKTLPIAVNYPAQLMHIPDPKNTSMFRVRVTKYLGNNGVLPRLSQTLKIWKITDVAEWGYPLVYRLWS